ncbi:ABC transporter permease [Pseudoalteromonas luteoviolacea]|uniref:ABC transporter permease n=1 Tax=Pseudoalteromonas luteoviolacea S4060-1 TaxID=1365257 RepID=A0A167MEJ4_9GAMM|nr:ABC transporter permease [Pseudoalteromonas luteoviolacea]KZN66262.1 hypothetical protein N478_20310 [Pseudoalteromonas luteoviolacea S4060-1]
MNQLSYQLKQAWAGLCIKKGFLVTIVTTLGITLGALLCILTLAYVMILKPLPYPEQEKIYQINSAVVDTERGRLGAAFEYPILIRLYDSQDVFSQSSLVRFETGVISSLPTQPTARTTFVTPGWFDLLGSTMALGRPFEHTEEKDSFNPVAVISYEAWRDEFNSDDAILDQSITIGATTYKVVGVLSEHFIEPEINGNGIKTDVFLPWDYNAVNLVPRLREGFGNFSTDQRFIGKLDSELSLSQVEQHLSGPLNAYWRENVSTFNGFENWSIRMELQPFKETILGDSENTVLLLLAGVAGLILIACTNITNLFMSRTADQQRQLAIQAAVGASKRHIFQMLSAQSGLVVFMSVVVGIAIAAAGFWVLQQYLALRLPRVEELSINGVTLTAALVITLLLGFIFARISAGMINYRALNSTLQSSGKGTGVQVSPTVRRWLVISQVSIVTLLIFVNIGLLKDSIKVINQPLGFETNNVSALSLEVNSAGNLSEEERKQLLNELSDKLEALPQVEGVARGLPPFAEGMSILQGAETAEERVGVRTKWVDHRYFQLFDIPLVDGDFFSEADFQDGRNFLIINDLYAKKLLDEGSVTEDTMIGTTILIAGHEYIIRGVVKGVKRPTELDVKLNSFLVARADDYEFAIKLKPNQTLSRELAVTLAQEVSSHFFVSKLETVNSLRDELLFTQYTTAITSAVLAVLTFFLATIGLYGILSYATQMRKFELGTRLAIGAKRGDIVRLIVKDNAIAVGIGFVISLVSLLALFIGYSEALSAYMNHQLIPLFVVTLLLICIMVLFACYWPARPIINSAPIRSLRNSE